LRVKTIWLCARTSRSRKPVGSSAYPRRIGAKARLTSLIHDARCRDRSGHLLPLAVLRGRPASLAFVSPHSDWWAFRI